MMGSRTFDVRVGERWHLTRATALLLLIVAGHTILETARDTLFLSMLPASRLNIVYVILAVLTFFAAAVSTTVAVVLGRRRALVGSLVLTAGITAALRFFTPTPTFAIVFYVYSGLIGAVVIPQFWLLMGQIFSVSQGRRLFGLLAAGGVVGGVAGASIAAVAIGIGGVQSLFWVSSVLFVLAMIVGVLIDDRASSSAAPADAPPRMSTKVFRDNPLLGRITILVVVSTATVLVVDYVFKSTAARSLSPAALGPFFARFYAVMNLISLVVQLLVASRVLRRLGVVGATAYTPVLLTLGGLGIFTTGAFAAVAIAKSIDGGLRYSLNKIATELLYLPLSREARERGKALIDGVVTRVTQAVTAGALYVVATRGFGSTRALGLTVAVLAVLWVASAVAIRGKYLQLFRTALAVGGLGDEPEDLDLASAETLVEGLASRSPDTVIAAMSLLAQKNHGRLIPALVLYHESEAVVVKALDLFAATDRTDWIPLAERLLKSPDERVRVAAIRALARKDVVSALTEATEDPSTRLQVYAAFHQMLRDGKRDLLDEPLIAGFLEAKGDYGAAARAELLVAIADVPTPRAAGVLLALARDDGVMQGPDAPALLARAMREVGDVRFVPALIQRLSLYVGRDSAREALVHMGDVAFDALVTMLLDKSTDYLVRVHIPRTLGAFGTQRAADVLTDMLKTETVGLVRYKVLRGLNMLVGANVRFDRARLEVDCHNNLVEHLRLVAWRVALGAPRLHAHDTASASGEPTRDLLMGLLADKIDQALERAFRLLELMYTGEDIHRVYVIARAGDRTTRTNALEYLDALLAGPSHELTRDLLRIVLDDVDDVERARRAASIVGTLPRDAQDAVIALIDDDDDLVAMLAARYASILRDSSLDAAVARALERPALTDLRAQWFGAGAPHGERGPR